MKSKLTITVASILSVLTLVGVGFAAWVISNPNVSADQTGTITAETVSDKSYTLEAVIAADDKIVFGAPAKMEAKNAWLTADTETQKEDLSATLTLTLKYKDWNYVPLNFSVTMKSKKGEANDTVFGDLVSKNYITNPKISYPSGSETITKDVKMNGTTPDVTIPKTVFTGINNEVTDTVKEATLKITITFGWGDHFKVGTENVNPYVFYNQEGKTYEANHADANTALTAISGLKDVSYTVTISGTTNTPNVSGK